jgi:hypothetical protein
MKMVDVTRAYESVLGFMEYCFHEQKTNGATDRAVAWLSGRSGDLRSISRRSIALLENPWTSP